MSLNFENGIQFSGYSRKLLRRDQILFTNFGSKPCGTRLRGCHNILCHYALPVSLCHLFLGLTKTCTRTALKEYNKNIPFWGCVAKWPKKSLTILSCPPVLCHSIFEDYFCTIYCEIWKVGEFYEPLHNGVVK